MQAKVLVTVDGLFSVRFAEHCETRPALFCHNKPLQDTILYLIGEGQVEVVSRSAMVRRLVDRAGKYRITE